MGSPIIEFLPNLSGRTGLRAVYTILLSENLHHIIIEISSKLIYDTLLKTKLEFHFMHENSPDHCPIVRTSILDGS